MTATSALSMDFDLVVQDLFSSHAPGKTYNIVETLGPTTGRVIDVLEFSEFHSTPCVDKGVEYKFWTLINKFSEYGSYSIEFAFRKFADAALVSHTYSKQLATALGVAWALVIGQHRYENIHGHAPVSTRNFVAAWLEHGDEAYTHGDIY